MDYKRKLVVSFIVMFVAVAVASLWSFWGKEKYEQYVMFRNACKSGNIFEYEAYYHNYSQGRFADIMRDSVVSYYSRVYSINEIYNAALRNQYNIVGERLRDIASEKAEKEYAKAVKAGSVGALERFVNDCPAEFQKDASAILEKLAWANDTVAWETARQRDTRASFVNYLDLYCDEGNHAKEAIDAYVGSYYIATSYPDFDLDKIGGGGRSSSVRIKNSTSHKMRVYFSGQDSKYMVIDSFKSGKVSLANGSYNVVISVDAPDVQSVTVFFELTGGSYYADFVVNYKLPRFRMF